MTYDNDYYVQGRQNFRLHRLFQPVLSVFYWLSSRSVTSHFSCNAKTRRRALDVGAGRGEFLYYLRKKDWDVVGTQISQRAIQAAQEYYDLDLLETPLPKACDLGSFDLITYWHSFEHMESPTEHLAEARKMLTRPESLLVIEVPNPESLGARLCFRSWLGSDVEHHIALMPYSKLTQMLESEGLHILQAENFSAKFTWIYLFSALCGFVSGGWLDFDYFMRILKRPGAAFVSSPARALSLILLFPFGFFVALLLIPVGIWMGRPEILRLYIKPAKLT